MRTCLLWLLLLAPHPQYAQHLCERNAWTKVDAEKELHSTAYGAFDPTSTSGQDWVCPCLSGNCIRLCQEGTVDSELLPFGRGNSSSSVTVWGENERRMVAIDRQFDEVLNNARCPHPQLLKPDENDHDGYKIFSNGSLFLARAKDSNSPKVVSPTNFCIIPLAEKDARAVLCHQQERQKTNSKHVFLKYFSHYYYICIISANCFFLLVNVVAYFLSADLKNLHGRSVASFSASLFVFYLYLLLTYVLEGTRIDIFICITDTFLVHFFTMSTMFWLNVICLDIYLTFKETFSARREIKFIYPSLYAWGAPTIMTSTLLILDLTTHNKTFSPNIISSGDCWYQEYTSELLYFHVPFAISVALNLILFCLTAQQLWRKRRESRKAFGGATCGRANAQDNDQFKMYVRLFVLMSVTSVNMAIHVATWTFDYAPTGFWFVVESFSYLRGALIFWVCIWSRKSVRNAFFGAFTCRNKN